MTCIRLLIGCMIFISGKTVQAQVYHSMNTLFDIESPSSSNPSLISKDTTFRIYLPEVYAGYSNSGPTFDQAFIQTATDRYTFRNNIQFLASENVLQAGVYIQTLGAAISIRDFTISAGHGYRQLGYLNYPKELLELYTEGNAQFIGQQIDIGPKVLLQNYHQYNLGITTEFKNISVGLRIKYISGVQDLSTSSSGIALTTHDDFYRLTFQNALIVQSSSLFMYENIEEAEFNLDTNIFKRPFGPNHGFGFDIGVNTEVNDALSLSVALYDIGRIQWSRLANTYTSVGDISYDGVDLLDVLKNDNYDLIDTLNSLLEVEKVQGNYQTSLPIRGEIGTSYKLMDQWKINGVIQGQYIQKDIQISASASAIYHATQYISLMGSLGYLQHHAPSLGLGCKLDWKPFSIFFYTNNIFGLYKVLDRSFSNVHIGSKVTF